MTEFTRRRFLGSAAAAMATAAWPVGAALREPTPRQTAGPFYPVELPLDDDNDLVRVAGEQAPARGVVTDLGGRLLDRNGRPLQDLRIEIWQCDANGRYRHPEDPGRRVIDPGFQGHGHTVTDAEGRYRFRTIRPVPYPGRTPHIHVAVFAPGESPFVTQLYVAGDPRNADDFLFRRVPTELRHLVVADFKPRGSDAAGLGTEWDIVLGMAPA